MLSSLQIENVAVIQKAEVHFEPGLNVLTGETGAGKSILLDSLGLATGMRADKRLVRHGKERGTVCAVFQISAEHGVAATLEEHGVELGEEGGVVEVFLRRQVYMDGRSRAFLNDQPVSIQLLKEIGGQLLEIHGQHDGRGLLDVSTHRDLLDEFAGLKSDVARVTETYETLAAARAALEEARGSIEAARSQADYYRHVLEELEKLDPQEGEDQELAEKRSFCREAPAKTL